MSPREPLRERVLRERDRQRRDALSEAARESMARNAFGRSWASSPIDKHSQSLVPDAQPSDTAVTMQGVASSSRVHTVTVEATSGQLLSDGGGPVQWAAAEDAPEGPLGFVAFRGATPTATVTCDITGVLAIDLEWRWADQGSGDGRFRTLPKVTLARNRQGTLVSRSWEDPQPGPGGDLRHLGLTVQGRDTVTLSLPHEAGSSKELGPARATFTLWETGPTQPAAGGFRSIVFGDDYELRSLSTDGTSTVLATNEDWFDVVDGAFDGTGLWVAHQSTAPKVEQLDGSGTRLSSFTFAWSPLAVAFDGTDLWLWDDTSGRIVRMSTGGSELSAVSSSLGLRSMVWHDGSLWGLTNSEQLVEVDTSDGTALSTVAISGMADGANTIAVDGQGRWWWAHRLTSEDDEVHRFDPDTGATLDSVTRVPVVDVHSMDWVSP